MNSETDLLRQGVVSLGRETDRMLRCLDRYWNVWEIDGNWMAFWWRGYEFYRSRVEELLKAARAQGGHA